jgi:hypothetical protein
MDRSRANSTCLNTVSNRAAGFQSLLHLLIFLLLIPLFASSPVALAGNSFGLVAGSAGAGVEVGARLHQKLRIRAVASGISIPIDVVEDDIDYTADVSTFFAGALLDVHPAANAFRFTFGLVLTELDIDLTSVATQDNYQVGDNTYSGTLQLDGNASFNPMAPWVSVGFASNLFGKGFYWSGDIGFALVGEPRLELSASGTATDNANPDAGQFDVNNSADFLQQLEQERLALEEEYSSFQIAPIINIGIGYRF